MTALLRFGPGLVVLLAGTAACGATDPIPRIPLEGAPALVASGRRCLPANDVDELPTVEQVLPPGLGSSLALWGYGRDPADTLTLSIRYGPEGGLQWVRLVGSSPAEGAETELERLVGSAVPGTGEPDWGVRLRITGAGTPVGVLPAVVCPPYRVSQLPTPSPRATRQEWAEMRNARGRRLEARVLLDDRGRILDVDLSRSSGSRLLDQHFMAMIRDASFRPQLHDGFPVAGVATITYAPW